MTTETTLYRCCMCGFTAEIEDEAELPDATNGCNHEWDEMPEADAIKIRKELDRIDARFSAEKSDEEIQEAMERLVYAVACLDPAGLSVEHKRAISDAKKIKAKLRKQ